MAHLVYVTVESAKWLWVSSHISILEEVALKMLIFINTIMITYIILAFEDTLRLAIVLRLLTRGFLTDTTFPAVKRCLVNAIQFTFDLLWGAKRYSSRFTIFSQAHVRLLFQRYLTMG